MLSNISLTSSKTTIILVALLSLSVFTVVIGSHKVSLGKTKSASQPIELTEDSWVQLLTGEWMVDFYAPWCPACKHIKPEWEKLAEWSDDLNIKVAWADVTQNPGLSGRFMVSGLPTIYHVKDGEFRLYTGPRDHKSIINLIEQQGWESIPPVIPWLSPNSPQMSFVAYSFRISMTLRDVHNYLVEEVGLPYYISYSLFALCTVTLGTILGLIIVFIVDQFCPSRSPNVVTNQRESVRSKRHSSAQSKKDESDHDDDRIQSSNSQDKVSQDSHLTKRKVN